MKLKHIRYRVICHLCGHKEVKDLIGTVGVMWGKNPGDNRSCAKCGKNDVRIEKLKN